MSSECASMAQSRQSDFSIEHILTKAGDKYNRKRRRIEETFSCSSNTSQSHSDSDEPGVSEEDEQIVVDSLDRADSAHQASYLQNCMPSFDWLYYTRYRPPKLPRPQKPGPVKRTPGRLPRVPFTPSQLGALEEAYKVSTYLSSEEANQLAFSLDLTNTRVKIWFQNRRARDRREKRENILETSAAVVDLTAPSAQAALNTVGHFAYFRSAPQSTALSSCSPTEIRRGETKSPKSEPCLQFK
ncbi:homeobox protein MSX-1 [Topomyia yanbarensis]|uniref:homeobox protein MSX-1 n=1 Tax=Topomyia yanbarensis TaxID=2498891 RepID=UPI00273CB46A|nr:homeobox protein MSX-1 [Topomyia yanbarensis]